MRNSVPSHRRSYVERFSTAWKCFFICAVPLIAAGGAFVLRSGNFASKSALRAKVEQFIAYFNETMAKPFRWTMEAKPRTG